jgi:uncharacterized membrane protein YhhN
MTKISGRIILLSAVIIGFSYAAAESMAMSNGLRAIWKGTSVGLLAVFAAVNARSLDGYLLIAVMSASMASDILLLLAGTTAGGLAFVLASLIALILYRRNRRPGKSGVAIAMIVAIVPTAALLAFVLPTDRAEALPITIFTIPLATMAACAWLSRFPRGLVGIGATLVLFSDLLIFARMGPLAGIAALNAVVWLLYFVGEVLVCLGVVSKLSADQRT